jgi:hypothetical protein
MVESLNCIPKALGDDSPLQLQVAVALRSICQHTRDSIERWFQKHYIETANLSFSNSTSQRTVPPSEVRTIVVSGDIIDGWKQFARVIRAVKNAIGIMMLCFACFLCRVRRHSSGILPRCRIIRPSRKELVNMRRAKKKTLTV